MVNEQIEGWIKREFDRWGDFIKGVNKRVDVLEKKVQLCREHCDHCREVCNIKGDYDERIRELEKQAVGSTKGSKLIATCAIVSGLMGVAGNLIARLF